MDLDFRDACFKGDLQGVQELIDQGETRWNYGMYGACESGNLQIIQLMIQKGADGWNAGLHRACQSGQLSVAQLMIEKGATEPNDGLYWACRGGNLPLVQFMIEQGANKWDLALFAARECKDNNFKIVRLIVQNQSTNLSILSVEQVFDLLENGTYIGRFEPHPKFKPLLQDIQFFREKILMDDSLIPDLLNLVSEYSLK